MFFHKVAIKCTFSFQLPKRKSPLLLLFQKSIIVVINYIKLFKPLIVSFSFVHAPECAYFTPFTSHNSIFLYFMLTKDSVNVIAYMTCLYLLLFKKKKKKKKTRMQIRVKSQKLHHNCPAIYLFSWEGEGNPYVSNPVNTFKSSKCAF